jgi:glucan phosphoethanolaminetransferase (alkaline phosphatase superfamily)
VALWDPRERALRRRASPNVTDRRAATDRGWRGGLRQLRTLGLAFVVCSIGFCLLDRFEFLDVVRYQLARRDLPNPVENAVVYAAAYFGCVFALACLYVHAWRPVRLVGQLLTVVTVTAYLGFRNVNGYGFTYHEALLFLTETSFIPDALRFFASSYVVPLVSLLAAVFAFERWGVPRLALVGTPLVLAAPLVAVYFHVDLLERTYSKVYQTPIPFRLPLLTWYTSQNRVIYYGRRDAPYLEPSAPAWADHIVLVMDESVRGDLLGVNGSEFDTTPFLSAQPERVCNYGVASSVSNVSSSTNIIVQSGLRLDELPDRELRSLKNPSLFSYMKAADFAPYMIDAQIYSEKPPNFMSQFDLDGLAGHVLIRREAVGRSEHEMDFAATERLAEIVRSEARSFTYVIKVGAHFPYTEKAAPESRPFQPALAIGSYERGTQQTLHSYLNALTWTVDAYLQDLVTKLEATGKRVLVLYTSDHGQSVLEPVAGLPHMGFPHATPEDPPVYQAMVPLLLLGVGDDVRAELAERCHAGLRDRVSGFEIFPTALVLAGYAADDVRRRYGPSLFDADSPRSERVFVSGNIFERESGYHNEMIRDDPHVHLNRFELPEVTQANPAGAR